MTKRPKAAMFTMFVSLLLVAGGAGVAQAHEGAGGNVGLGVGFGAPTALSLEIAPTPWSGLELALGLRTFANDDVYTHLTYKQDLVNLASGPSVMVPLYVGFGGFVRDYGPNTVTDVGARVPLGVNFDFRRSPVQMFGELAFEATLASDAPINQPFGLGAFAGARVWF